MAILDPATQAGAVVDFDLGNLADLSRVMVNPTHITHVRLMGKQQGDSRKMEIHLVNGSIVGMNFDDPVQADLAYNELADAICRILPTA